MRPEGGEGNRIGVHHSDDEGRQAGRCRVPTHHEVPERPKRRRSTAEYKLAILKGPISRWSPGRSGPSFTASACYGEPWQLS